MPSRKSSPTEPAIVDMPARKMAVVTGKGSPDKVFPDIFPALYGSVYTLKFALKKKGLTTFKVEPPRARYPDALQVPEDQWTIITGLPVPDDTESLPQKVAGKVVGLETWKYGKVAQILHIGPYDQEKPTIERLIQFIKENGYEITGPHEEEYLTKPDAKIVKTMIRLEVKKKQ